MTCLIDDKIYVIAPDRIYYLDLSQYRWHQLVGLPNAPSPRYVSRSMVANAAINSWRTESSSQVVSWASGFMCGVAKKNSFNRPLVESNMYRLCWPTTSISIQVCVTIKLKLSISQRWNFRENAVGWSCSRRPKFGHAQLVFNSNYQQQGARVWWLGQVLSQVVFIWPRLTWLIADGNKQHNEVWMLEPINVEGTRLRWFKPHITGTVCERNFQNDRC